jgi:hypothetical protein
MEPVLDKHGIFPRRRVPWHQTSQGTRLRLILLPKNPHMREDIKQVRYYLGIPEDHIRPTSDDPFWKEVSRQVKPDSVRKVVEGNLAAEWLHVHRYIAAGNTMPDSAQLTARLSQPMIESAVKSAAADLTSPDTPEWLRRLPSTAQAGKAQLSPVDLAVNKMVERHRLPRHVSSALSFYLLTLNIEWAEGLELIEVEIDRNSDKNEDIGAFDIKLKGIDEYITYSDWEHTWKTYIEPRQRKLFEQRGMDPQGRRSKRSERLERVIDLYTRMVNENLKMPEVIGQCIEDLDQETIRDAITDLKTLLTPRS